MQLISSNNVIFFLLIVLINYSSGHKAQQISALKKALFRNYEKDVKPDGQIVVRAGMTVTDFSLCPHRKVKYILLLKQN